MKILKSWLNDYISEDLSTKRLSEILELAGLDIEEVILGIDNNVIVAQIKKIEKHPDADKLKIVVVSDGKGEIKVVCGATNISVGQIVPLALPGTKLSSGEIKKIKIRGVESHGMLCSQDELGIGDDKSGIFILPESYEIGKSLSEYLGSDVVFDLDITANRGDCLSHIGIAREIAAFLNTMVKKTPISLKKTFPEHTSSKLSLEIEEPDLCRQYLSRIITGVKIGPSPKWLRERLIACGAKPINNVVDVTNYILLDLGHPIHAFDWKKIKGSKIIIRKAKKNEDIVTLDDKNRNLTPEMLVIADGTKPIAIAGVMGGENSEVDNETETVVLEAAQFDKKNIRKTSKTLNLSTEASYRFERGIDDGAIEYVVNKAADLIVKVASGKIIQGIVQAGTKPTRIEIKIQYDSINQLLGLKLKKEDIDHILRHLGFSISRDMATVPTWRHDISIWEDLAEEIGRITGYDKVRPITLPKISSPIKTTYYFDEKLKDLLISFGYTETINYPFLSKEFAAAAKLDFKDLLEIANPTTPENIYLRSSLLPGLVKNVAKNPSFDSIQIFEIGHVFTKNQEYTNLAIATAGKSINYHDQLIDKIVDEFKIARSEIKTIEFSHQDLEKYKVKKPKVLVSEINLSKILKNRKIDQEISLAVSGKKIVYRGVSKYPATTRDLAFVVDKKNDAEKISDEIYTLSELVNRVELFDEFVSEKFGVNKKNIAFHIYLQSSDKTLKDAETEAVIQNIIKSIEKKFRAKLRKA